MSNIRRRTNHSLVRNTPKKDPYDIVLIVCEGEKTEPAYFKDLILFEKLSYANIVVTGDCGSDPISVVNKAIKLHEENKEESLENQYDQIYCLIDRDSHPNFDSAIDKIHTYNNNNRKMILFPVRSFPSFEYWYLCHFTYTRAAIYAAGGKSAGERCLDELNKYWRVKFGSKNSYKKNDPKVYTKINQMNIMAIENAKNGYRDAKDLNSFNPSTEVWFLLLHLLQVKSNSLPTRTLIISVNDLIKNIDLFNAAASSIDSDNHTLVNNINFFLIQCSTYVKLLAEFLDVNPNLSIIYKEQLKFLIKVLNELKQTLDKRLHPLILLMEMEP